MYEWSNYHAVMALLRHRYPVRPRVTAEEAPGTRSQARATVKRLPTVPERRPPHEKRAA